MLTSPLARSRRRPPAAAICLVLGAAALGACAEVETSSVEGYHPSKVEPLRGSEFKLVKFTAEGAKRTGLQTAAVRRSGDRKVIPYAALIYDPHGGTYVYTSPRPLTFVRQRIKVERIDGGRVLLSDGPPAGTDVVTVGAAEVYGTELEIDSSH